MTKKVINGKVENLHDIDCPDVSFPLYELAEDDEKKEMSVGDSKDTEIKKLTMFGGAD